MDLFFQPLSSRLATHRRKGNAALGLPRLRSLIAHILKEARIVQRMLESIPHPPAGSMKKLLHLLATMAALAAGCGGWDAPHQPSGLPVRYHNAQYGFSFFLGAGWRGYSEVIQQWKSSYLPEWWRRFWRFCGFPDKNLVTEHGPVIILRHPQWKASAPYQDIPVLVFTRSQWDALHQGKLWPSFYAGGVIEEIWHNGKYVFGISTRYNTGDSVEGWKEVADIVERNCNANRIPHLYPE